MPKHRSSIPVRSVVRTGISRLPFTGRYPSGSQLAAVVKLVYTLASGASGLYARGGSSPLSRTPEPLLDWPSSNTLLPLSSRGLGRRPLTAETGVRIPVAVLTKAPEIRGLSSF